MIDHDPAQHAPDDAASSNSASPRVTRRGLFGAIAVGVGAYGLSRLPAGANGTAIESLTEPGLALENADRLPHPTTTTTVPPTTTIPLADGEVLFPVLVGEEDFCYVLDNFGDCRGSGCSRAHEGVDIMADPGLPVIAVASGVLTKKYVDRGLTYGAGNGWTLTNESTGIVYKFFHLESHEEGLEEGDTVEMGQVIGYVGETGTSGAGNSTSNFHCHFEYRPGNVAQNSYHILQRPEHVQFEGG